MDGFFVGYLLGRKKERRLLARAASPYVPVGKPWVTGRGVRRVAVALVVLVLLLLVAFVVYAVALGIQHHLIYFTRG